MIEKDTFISQNKDIIIEFQKEKRNNLFNTTSEGNQYICKLIFKNNLGIILKEITTTEIEIYKLIDCIYWFLEDSYDMVYYFNTDSYRYNNPVIIIRLETSIINGNSYLNQNFYMYDMNDDNMTKIFSFDISDNIVELIDKLYRFFIIDSNIQTRDLLNPYNLLE